SSPTAGGATSRMFFRSPNWCSAHRVPPAPAGGSAGTANASSSTRQGPQDVRSSCGPAAPTGRDLVDTSGAKAGRKHLGPREADVPEGAVVQVTKRKARAPAVAPAMELRDRPAREVDRVPEGARRVAGGGKYGY